MELIYIFRILSRKKWIILGCSILAVAIAFALTINKKKVYKSVAQLSTGYTVTEELKLSEEIFSLPQIDVKFNNAIADIISTKVLSLLSYRLILNDLNSSKPFRQPDPAALKEKTYLKNFDKAQATRIFNNKKDSIQILNPADATEKKLLELLEAYEYNIASINKYLYVGRHGRTDYIDIVFRSENPELSSFVVNSLSKEFQRYYDSFRRERGIESMIAIDSLVKKRKQDLDDKIAMKARFLTDSVSSSLDANLVGVNTLSQISNIESALAIEEGNVQDLTYQIEQLNVQLKGTRPNTSTVTNNSNNSQWLLLRREYYDLLAEYTQKGSNDPAMKKRLDDLKTRMDAAAPITTDAPVTFNQGSIFEDRKINAEGQLRSARSKINNYRGKLSELNAKLRNASPTSTAALDKYDRDIEVAQLEYTTMREKLNKTSGMNEAYIHTFKQTLFGQPAIEPEPSRRMILLGLSGLSAFILSSLIFVFIAYIDQSIKTPSQFHRQINLKLLGTVNLINLKQTKLDEQITQIEVEDAKRNNSFRELLRKLRYEIEKSGKRVILFTSTEPRQGKTTISQALAFSFSISKKKVLLLDTNFCNNDLTVLNNALPTLEQFSGNGQLDSNQFENLITKTGVENVDIIGCKGGDYTPTEILPKNHLLNYLPDLLKHYDYVFMEAAPLNGFTDTKELVQYADGIIAIFSATAEVRQADKESIKYLHELDDKFLGAILNKVGKTDINL